MVAPKPISAEELVFLSNIVAVDSESPSGLVYKNPVKNDHKNKPGDVAGKRDKRTGYWRFCWNNQRPGYSRSCQALVLELSGKLSPSSNHEPDHIDRDRGNNKLGNLRWVSRSIQCGNRHYGKLKYPWLAKKRNGKFAVQFQVNGKKHWRGMFDTEELAYAAAVKMRAELGIYGPKI